jgi:hypothetical protein
LFYNFLLILDDCFLLLSDGEIQVMIQLAGEKKALSIEEISDKFSECLPSLRKLKLI